LNIDFSFFAILSSIWAKSVNWKQYGTSNGTQILEIYFQSK
jgi:hypothetical protein